MLNWGRLRSESSIITFLSSKSDDSFRFQHIFCDKTGTLTRNEMVLAKCSIRGLEYCQPFEDKIIGKLEKCDSHNFLDSRRFLLVLALCNDVLPATGTLSNNSLYEGASPDELALVKVAAANNIILKEKRHKLWFINELGIEKEYEVLNFFPFSPETKRVSVLLKNNNTYILMVKGADQVVLPMCTSESLMKNVCDDITSFAMEVTWISQNAQFFPL
jgi:magnesium-transporting ATPase (P-type)